MAPVREVLPYEAFLAALPHRAGCSNPTGPYTSGTSAAATVGVKRKAGAIAAATTPPIEHSGDGEVGCGSFDWGCLQNVHVRAVLLQDFGKLIGVCVIIRP